MTETLALPLPVAKAQARASASASAAAPVSAWLRWDRRLLGLELLFVGVLAGVR